jgi:hypothetical protein
VESDGVQFVRNFNSNPVRNDTHRVKRVDHVRGVDPEVIWKVHVDTVGFGADRIGIDTRQRDIDAIVGHTQLSRF